MRRRNSVPSGCARWSVQPRGLFCVSLEHQRGSFMACSHRLAHRSAPQCGLTLRSSGPPPAWRLGREASQVIVRLAAQAPIRRGPLSSNVRPHETDTCECAAPCCGQCLPCTRSSGYLSSEISLQNPLSPSPPLRQHLFSSKGTGSQPSLQHASYSLATSSSTQLHFTACRGCSEHSGSWHFCWSGLLQHLSTGGPTVSRSQPNSSCSPTQA